MGKGDSNWYVPADWLCQLGLVVVFPCIVLLAAILLPVIERLEEAEVGALYGCGLGAGVAGVVLLFLARRPLYRERRFWTLGPGLLDRKHRRFYWLAYAAVATSVLLLGIVWLRTE